MALRDYPLEVSFSPVPGVKPSVEDHAPPRLSDIGRYGRYVMHQLVAKARTVDRPTFRSILTEHLGEPVYELPVIVELSGDSLSAIGEACSVARALQPAMIVVEDVDLIAEERDHYGGDTPLLFTLLNEMDGLDEDADVVFLLTTNRADLLEPALASRPGRVDQAVHIELPDRESRRQLIELYRGKLDLDLSRLDAVLDRTDGVTASFLKELLRRAAVVSAERQDQPEESRLEVIADDLDTALDELLDTRNQMTRAVLGFSDKSTAFEATPRETSID